MATPIKNEGLMLNRWAESLSKKQMRMLFPDADESELPYQWNKLPMNIRKELFNKWKEHENFGIHAVISRASFQN